MPDEGSSSAAVWIGRLLSTLVVAALLVDGTMQWLAPTKVAPALQEIGFQQTLTTALGAIMVGCAVFYAIPATTVLGAILVTGFLGGAICAHIRLGELGSVPELLSALLGVTTWSGLYLRDPRLHALLPLRSALAQNIPTRSPINQEHAR